MINRHFWTRLEMENLSRRLHDWWKKITFILIFEKMAFNYFIRNWFTFLSVIFIQNLRCTFTMRKKKYIVWLISPSIYSWCEFLFNGFHFFFYILQLIIRIYVWKVTSNYIYIYLCVNNNNNNKISTNEGCNLIWRYENKGIFYVIY